MQRKKKLFPSSEWHRSCCFWTTIRLEKAKEQQALPWLEAADALPSVGPKHRLHVLRATRQEQQLDISVESTRRQSSVQVVVDVVMFCVVVCLCSARRLSRRTELQQAWQVLVPVQTTRQLPAA